MDLISQEYNQGINNKHCQDLIDYSNDYGKYIYFIGISGAGDIWKAAYGLKNDLENAND